MFDSRDIVIAFQCGTNVVMKGKSFSVAPYTKSLDLNTLKGKTN